MATYVFDLDGTIVESAPGIFVSLRHTLVTLGLEPPGDEVLRHVIGPPVRTAFTMLLGDSGHDVETSVAAYRAHYGEVGITFSEPFAGMVDALRALHAEGHTLFVCTSKLETFARVILDRLALTPLFAGIYGEGPTGEHKPELLARLVRKHRVDAANAVMIGDRREDVVAGQASGLKTLGVLWGYGSRGELSEAGASAICADVSELCAALAAL